MKKNLNLDIPLLVVYSILALVGFYGIYNFDIILKFLNKNEDNLESIGVVVPKSNLVKTKSQMSFNWKTAKAEKPLYHNDSIFTGKDSSAIIYLIDKTQIKLNSESMISIQKESLTLDQGTIVTELPKGKQLKLMLKNSKKPVLISSKNPSSLSIKLSKTGKTSLNVIKGNIKVKNSKKSISLSKNKSLEGFESKQPKTSKTSKPKVVEYRPLKILNKHTYNNNICQNESKFTLEWSNPDKLREFRLTLISDKKTLIENKFTRETKFIFNDLKFNTNYQTMIKGYKNTKEITKTKVFNFKLSKPSNNPAALKPLKSKFLTKEKIDFKVFPLINNHSSVTLENNSKKIEISSLDELRTNTQIGMNKVVYCVIDKNCGKKRCSIESRYEYDLPPPPPKPVYRCKLKTNLKEKYIIYNEKVSLSDYEKSSMSFSTYPYFRWKKVKRAKFYVFHIFEIKNGKRKTVIQKRVKDNYFTWLSPVKGDYIWSVTPFDTENRKCLESQGKYLWK